MNNTDNLKAFLKKTEALWPVAKGSLAEVRKPCIRPNCRACTEGRKHRAHIFSLTKDGKRRCMHVPKELVPALKRAIANGRRLERMLFSLGERMIRDYRRKRR